MKEWSQPLKVTLVTKQMIPVTEEVTSATKKSDVSH